MILAKHKNKPEIFISIQGEGESIGEPAIFIRLWGCNLRCKWCDTKYTWGGKNKPKISITPKEVATEIRRAFWDSDKKTTRVIFTGGEPLMQQKEIVEVIVNLKKSKVNWNFEVETNGTIMPKTCLSRCVDLFNVSPKLASSGNKLSSRVNQDVIRHFAMNADSFKFVIANKKDLKEVLFLIKRHKIQNAILVPEGIDNETMKKNFAKLIKVAIENNLRVLPRLQIFLWGNKRGV